MKPVQQYRICTRCIMDTSDPGIEFNAQGICNRCRSYEFTHAVHVPPRAERERLLTETVDRIKSEGRGKPYDCVLGVSGGVDSTYAAYLAYKLGLRPLAVHMDNGWNSELAVSNIERCVKALSMDLYTWVLDWDEFRDLQVAFLKASTSDSEIPTDHAILAVLMKKAAELNVRYIISGANIATEGLPVPTWSAGHYDWKYIQTVVKLFGRVPLKTFPHFTLSEFAYHRYIRRQQFVYLLDYVDYHKQSAMEVIQRELGWQAYTGKHHESVYTRFFQSFILPKKFGYDKRRMHLATLVMSGQLTRDQALEEMNESVCSPDLMREDKIYVIKKLAMTEPQFEEIMRLEKKTFWDYPSNEKRLAVRAYRAYKRHRQRRKLQEARSATGADKLATGRVIGS